MKTSKSTMEILKAILTNPRMSDRKLADLVGVSQPTITRQRNRMMDTQRLTFLAIPNLAKIGYPILTLTVYDADEVVVGDSDSIVYSAIGVAGKRLFIIAAHRNIEELEIFKAKYPALNMICFMPGLMKTTKALSFASLINTNSKT